MISPEAFFRYLSNNDIDFFTGVPDSFLRDIIAYIADHCTPDQHVIAANEGGAIALGVGYHLATRKIPFIYMQNSGLGNAVNPLLTLADPDIYSIPMLILIGWRGEPELGDEPQHKKDGRVIKALLNTMEIPYTILDANVKDLENLIRKAVQYTQDHNAPYGLVARKGTFAHYTSPPRVNEVFPAMREDVVKMVANEFSHDDIILSTTGMTSRELFEYRESLGQTHEKDFLVIGSMGHSSQIALGIAMRKKNKQVVCIDGDGSAIMHMGSLAINGFSDCKNFKHVIVNNGAHDSVGGQPTLGLRIDFTGIAKAVGYKWVVKVSMFEEIRFAIRKLRASEGPALLEVLVRTGSRPDLGRPTVPPLKRKAFFMNFVQQCNRRNT